jgi:dihydrofolate synthase / folylpolyglutamate synthase
MTDEGMATVPDDPRAFWYGLINYEQRTPAAADLSLDRMRALLARLGDPQRRLRIVHVAGSKGKGSTSAMLAAALQSSGYRTGLFTSPHLCRVEERFQVDGRPITPAELTVLLREVRDCVRGEEMETGPLESRVLSPFLPPPTFFEVATAVGFLHFVRRGVAVAVLEVGLGGRFDSTNVCDPLLAVITSISFDHTRQLGNRLTSIAREKAGIVKRRRPVVSGVVVPEARAVIEQTCKERAAPLWQLGVAFHYRYQPGLVTADTLRRPRVTVTTPRRRWPEMELNLLGEHQAANASVAVACIERLRAKGFHVPDAAVARGLAGVVWPARMEVLARRPLVVLDCAHNVASAAALVETLQSSFPPARRLLLFAGSTDKDVAGMFRVLAPHFAHAFLTRYTDNPRGVAPEQLSEWWRAAGDVPATACATPAQAWQAARALAGADDLICVTGSVFLAGELRPLLLAEVGG